MKMLRLVMNMGLVAMFLQMATATDHTVGSPRGSWDQFTDLKTWAGSQTFMVGDSLIFQYSPMHNVLEVSKTDYESCTTSSPIMIDTSGNTIVPLKASGKRYFICGIPGHCQIGMKMEVDINPSNPPSPTPPSFSTPSNPPPSSSTPPPPKSHFVPPPSSSTTPSKTPESSTDAMTPKASPYGGPTSPVGSPALAAASSSTMKGGFKPMMGIVIATVLIVIHGF